MLIFLIILGFVLAFLLLSTSIYLVACALTTKNILNKHGKLDDNNVKEVVRERSKLNLPLNISLKLCEAALNKQSNGGAKLVKAIILKMKAVCFSVAGTLLVGAIYAFAFASAMYSLNIVATSAATNITTLFDDIDGCKCYALCTGDDKIDKKCTYELLFGEDAYTELVKCAKMDEHSKSKFNELKTGEEKGEFLISFMNEHMVSAYIKQLENNKNFRKGDGLDRQTMSIEDLEDDLIRLLSDYKVNGKNPSCECNKFPANILKNKCLGEKHYKKPFLPNWRDTFAFSGSGDGTGDNPSEGGNSGGFGVLGQASGEYAVQLDDGMWYWYHQDGGKGCGCTYCGDWSMRPWGNTNFHAFGQDGCAVYSLAMLVSNLKGTAITPTQLLQDFGVTINGAGNFYTGSSASFTGRCIVYAPATSTIQSKYGLTVEALNKDIASIDSVLDRGGLVWTSWKNGPSPWYEGTGHYMVIRKKSDTQYWCLTSCRGSSSMGSGKQGAINTMNAGVDKQTVINYMGSAPLYGFIPDLSTIPEGGDVTGGEYTPSGSWYSSASSIPKSTSKIKLTDDIYLYNGLPWDAGSAYIIDTDLATKSLYDYVKSVSGTELSKSYSWATSSNGRFSKGVGVYSGTGNYMRGSGWTSNSTSGWFKQLNGVNCLGVAPLPIVVSRDYCNDFTSNTWKNSSTPSASLYDYSNKRMALILESKSGSGVYYLPVTTADAKGHTFPGGIVQTNVKINGTSGETFNVAVASTTGDAGGGTQSWKLGELGNKLNTVTSAGSPIVAYMYAACETYGWGSSIYSTIKGNYRLIGYVVW